MSQPFLRVRLFVVWGFALATMQGCADQPEGDAVVERRVPEKVDAEHLPNVYRLTEKVFSGGQPEGEAGFRELDRLGIKTVISVDGAEPDVEAAREHGLRYVHLPHGYNGVPAERARELAKAVRDLPGPIYIHCHHGKHRSPAAATVACVGAGLLSPQRALGVLRTAGTSAQYRGLYESAAKAQRFDDALLDALTAEFAEKVEIPPMAETMVSIEHTHDRLKAIQTAGWKTPADHPDLDPPHEALMLREHFTELLRTKETRQRGPQFVELLRESETAAGQLETGLREWNGSEGTAPATVADAFAQITKNCKSCHQAFRDIPLGEDSPR